MKDKQQAVQFGEFTLHERIASGGMAEIFRATSKGLGGFEKTLAIKRLHPEYSLDEQFVRMIVDEAQITVRLQHPNVVQIFDLGRVEGMYYISMEFVEGPDLFRLLQVLHDASERIPLEAACYLLIEVCNGLHYAHFRKKADNKTPLHIVHRDVSPQNILLSWDGEVKIADFGIAKAEERLTRTQTGVIKGKFYYMSPEQAVGADLDRRSDIFSAGILLFEVLTATPLYEDPDGESVINLVRKAAVRSPLSERSDIPPELESIVMCALQKDPENRFNTAQHMARALHELVSERYGVYTRTDFSNYLRNLFRNTPGYSEQDGKSPIFTPPANGVTLEKFHHTQSGEVDSLPEIPESATSEEALLEAEPTKEPLAAAVDLPSEKETLDEVPYPSSDKAPTKPDGHEPPVIITGDPAVSKQHAPDSSKKASMQLAMVRRLPPLESTNRSSRRSYTKRREMVLKVALTIVGLAILGVSIAILNVVMTWDASPRNTAFTPKITTPTPIRDKTTRRRSSEVLPPKKSSAQNSLPRTSARTRQKPALGSTISVSRLRIQIDRPANLYRTYVDGELAVPRADGSFGLAKGRHIIRLQLFPERDLTEERVVDVTNNDDIVVEFNTATGD